MKIFLNEQQLKMIKRTITESSDVNYERKVGVRVYTFNSNFKGNEISDVNVYGRINLSFVIDMEIRSWGVKSVSLYGISGPESIPMTVDYYINEKGDYESEEIEIKLDWDKLETENRSEYGMISVGDELEIGLMNDESGNLVMKSMSIETYSL